MDLTLFEPITRSNLDRLKEGEWIWDNRLTTRPAHGRSLSGEEIEEPIGFRQVHIVKTGDPYFSKQLMLSDIHRGGYRWEYLDAWRFYKFKEKEKE